MKILLLDLESSPNTAHVWGLFKQTVSINQLMESSYVLCWAAKWLGDEEEIIFRGLQHSSTQDMLAKIHELIDEADAVVHYNGTKFDMPTLNKEFLLHGFGPPSPYKNIDLLQTVRQRFRFPSKKLDYVAQRLNLGKKTEHMGHELWVRCMAKDPKAWATMEEYNINDVILLEKVYYKLLPWIKNHPNRNVYSNSTVTACPHCGGTDYQRRGTYATSTLQYHRYWCKKCGTWFRGHKAVDSFKGFRNVT